MLWEWRQSIIQTVPTICLHKRKTWRSCCDLSEGLLLQEEYAVHVLMRNNNSNKDNTIL